MPHVGDGVTGVEGPEHRRVAQEVIEARQGQHPEPRRHHGPEQEADGPAALPLDREQRHQDRRRQGHDVGRDRRQHDLEPLDGGEDRDGRRDHGVAEEERRPGETDDEEGRAEAPRDRQGQRQERHGPALALVVGPHDEDHVFDGHDEEDGPEHHRQDAQHGRLGGAVPGGLQRLPERIDRARPDVAEDDAQRPEQQRAPSGVARLRGGRRRRNRAVHVSPHA